jgi:hypothetical protein
VYPLSSAVRARTLAETAVMHRGSRRDIYLMDYYARIKNGR